MALQDASVTTAAYSAKNYDYIYNSLTFFDVDAEIKRVQASSKCASFHLVTQLDNNIHKIKQSDDSLLDTTEIEAALEAKGYKANVVWSGLTIELSVFWD